MVLNDISLKIEKGQKIAIVGKSGCGKTTLVKLLLGFYEFEHGEILINNIHVDAPTLIQLRNRVAYVSQNDYFFADSIKNNLILGNDSIKQSEIKKYAISAK